MAVHRLAEVRKADLGGVVYSRQRDRGPLLSSGVLVTWLSVVPRDGWLRGAGRARWARDGRVGRRDGGRAAGRVRPGWAASGPGYAAGAGAVGLTHYARGVLPRSREGPFSGRSRDEAA